MQQAFSPLSILAALVFASGCMPYEVPLRPKKDPRLREAPNVIQGSISLIGPEEPAPTMVLVFDNENPGPPAGTTGPVDFATVGADAYGGSLEYGFNAPFSVGELPDGAFQIEAIVDVDGDFSPGAFTLGGATCGDWQGAYYRPPGSGIKGAIGVEGGELIDGVPLTIDTQLDTERPGFILPETDGFKRFSLSALGASPVGLTYPLQSSGIHVQYDDKGKQLLDLADACSTDPAAPNRCAPETTCETAFSVWYPDADGNGLMDPHPDFGDFGLKDVWPRILLEYLGTVELDANGIPERDPDTGYPVITPPDLPDGVYWGTENFTFGQEGAFGIALAPVGVPTKMPEVTAMFPPLVAKFFPEGDPICAGAEGGCSEIYDLSVPEQRAQVPRGVWGVNVISWTGQTWGLPNEISEWGTVISTDPNFDIKSQGGFVLTVD